MSGFQTTGGDRIIGKLRQMERNARETVRSMNGRQVSVRIPAGAKYPNGTPVRKVAMFIEYGTASMPPRPYMRMARAEHKAEWWNMIRREMRLVVKKQETVTQGLKKVGAKMEQDIKAAVTAVDAVDTGRLRDSYKAVVR